MGLGLASLPALCFYVLLGAAEFNFRLREGTKKGPKMMMVRLQWEIEEETTGGDSGGIALFSESMIPISKSR